MKHTRFFMLALSIALGLTWFNVFSQQNPVNGYIADDQDYLNSLPVMQLSAASAATTLPAEVDNSQQIFFPHTNDGYSTLMYNQKYTGSCTFASTIYYTYAYEHNRLLGVAGNTPQTRFAPNSLYNYYNGGNIGMGSSFLDVFNHLKNYGVMTEADWGNLEALDYLRWQTGYDAYKSMTSNLTTTYATTIQLNLQLSGLETMKHYLNDHNEGGSAVGGLLNMGVLYWCHGSSILPPNSAYAGQNVKFDNSMTCGGHAVTIVGYCEDVKYDWGGAGTISNPQPDGQFRNDIDNNHDGVIDLRDCEIGAVKVADNYGTQGNGGFEWVLYRCLYNTQLIAITPKIDYHPDFGAKIKLSKQDRGNKHIYTSKGSKANSAPGEYLWSEYSLMKIGSANDPIRGAVYTDVNGTATYTKDYNPLETFIDKTATVAPGYIFGKLFLKVSSTNSTGLPDDQIHDFVLVDYRWNETFELACDQHNVPIGNPTILAIEYDLIPHESPITTATTFNSNMVSRFSPVFTGNSTYDISNDVRFDMYNSTITLEQGSSLSLGNNVIIRGKRGDNKLIINGNILPMGTNVKFEAEPGATLEVIYENPSVAGLLENCIFNNAVLTAQAGTLTVKNSTFTLLPGNKVIVKPTAKLILDASLLTKSAASQWQGIEVWGNSYQHQQTINGLCEQGTLELKNNTIIENAYNGITNWKPNDWNSIGGIIIANGATFRNNRRSVEFMKYKNFDPATGKEIDNLSSFSTCSFEINDQYPAGAAPYFAQASLWYVKGIKFYSCDFLNNRTNNFTGYGIYSLDAGYKVSLPVSIPGTPIDRSAFRNFEYGIYASNSETSNTVYVNYGDFTNNGKGISLLSVNSAVVLNSLFDIGISAGCPNQGTGISMNACTGYSIEKNTFTGGTGVQGATYTGIDITNSGTAYNEIYQNTFHNLTYGNLANQVNGTSNNLQPTGLTYLCNVNSGNINDFYVTNNSRISYFQRSGSSVSAGNSFSNNASYNFYNGGSTKISYYYSPGQAPFVYYNLLLVPTANSNGCPDHYGDGMGDLVNISTSQTIEKEQQYANAFSAYNNVKAVYESLKDGGNTANMVDDIATSIPSEMWELRNKLLGDSPHLSQTSLKEASLKNDVLPESVLFDVLAANPDELRDQEFLDFLKTKDNPMPDYMVELLSQIAGNTSGKTIIQEQLFTYDMLKSSAADDILRSKLNDTTFDQMSILNWLDNKGDLASQYQMIDTWLQTGSITAAQVILSTIPEIFQLSESETADYQNFSTVKNIQFNLKNSGRNLFMLDSTEISSLTAIANSGKGIASAQAKGILGFTAGNQYCQCNQDDLLKHSAVIPKVKTPESGNIELAVSPNPATTWIAFDYTLPDSYSSVTLTIYDNTGRVIEKVKLTGKQGQKVLNTSSYPSGAYAYKCKQLKNGSGKFIIQ